MRHLLAGSAGSERQPARRDPREPRWFEPAHVRDPGRARSAIADQVAAGADVVCAPTWRTHRRALIEVGEARRAREWTLAAVTIAREGIEAGLDLRARTEDPDVPGTDRPSHPSPLVAGAVPVLEEDRGAGQQRPSAAGSQHDLRDHAGILADADVDLLLVEVDPASAAAAVALEAALVTGVPVWVAARGSGQPGSGHLDGTEAGGWLAAVERWAEAAVARGAELLLAAAPPAGTGAPSTERGAPAGSRAIGRSGIEELSAILARVAGHAWGGLLAERGGQGVDEAEIARAIEAEAGAWLEHGAGALGVLEGAVAPVLAAARTAIDRSEAVERAALEAAEARWRAFLATAARMAPGGAALWLGGDSVALPLPPGFDWLVLPRSMAPALPAGRYRLIVDAPGEREEEPPLDLAALLDEGGLLVGPLAADRERSLRLVRLDDEATPPLAVYRNEG